MSKEQSQQEYEKHVKPYLESKDPALKKKAVEVACKIFTPFIEGYSSRRQSKLGKFSVKIATEDVKSTAYYAVVAHLDQANPVDFLMFCKYMITWIRKEVSKVCHFDEDYLCTFSDIVDEENVYEVEDHNSDTEKEALFSEVFELLREAIKELPPKIRDSLQAAYVREDSIRDMCKSLPHYAHAKSYWLAMQKAVPLLKEILVDKYGWGGYYEIEEFFLQEDFSN